MKTSPTTGKPTFALGIKDEAFLEMLDHPVDEVRELVVARMGLKSSIEESRCEQFLKLAEFEAMPAPYKISGARTHRLGSADALGLQNLPSGRIKGQSKAMRESIEAPDGHELIGCDASQIEVRTIDYIAGDIQGVEDHRNGVCPYSSVAVQLYGEGTPDQIKRDAKKGIEPWASRRQVSKSARLSLQFGSGAEGFRLYCKTSGVTITAEEAEFYKSGFRRNKPVLVNFWKQCGLVLGAMLRGESGYFGGMDGKMFFYDGARTVLGEHIPGIMLPDGVWTSYPKLRLEEGKFGPSYVTTEMTGRKADYLYWHGAKVAQNLTQAVAFSILKYYATVIDYKIVLNSHDEHVLCVPIAQADAASAELESLMKTAPPWAPGLPLDCEVHRGFNYGELK
jgi:DNA polymerase